MFILQFLIFFPFAVALLLFLMGNGEKVYAARKYLVRAAALCITAAVIYLTVAVLGGREQYEYLYEVPGLDRAVMAGEILLMGIVTFYAFRCQRIYAALLSWIGTIPMLWLDLSGKMPEGAAHFRVDNLTVIMCLMVGVVGCLICNYAVGYIKDYHQHHRDYPERSNWFLAMLFVFMGAMFGLLFSDSMAWMYFFWEITSVCSFLLIGYNKQEEAIRNSFKALWMNLLGGCGFMAAILYSALALGITNLSQLLTVDKAACPGVMIVLVMLSFAAMTKSAQFPFCGWLLGAMVAPTPTSALLHSATMVKAGVYLLIRIAPMLEGTLTGVLVTLIGGFTFFAASLMAIATSDGKRVLAHSTISNLGLIVACAGVGHPESVWAAVMLVLFHGVSKSLMFLCVGAVENVTGSRNIEDMHGLIIKLPRLAIVMIIGICGMYLAPFGMLIAKWAALKSYIDSNSVWLVLFLIFGTSSTSFYWGKWLGKLLAVIHKSQALKDTTHRGEWFSIVPLASLVVAMCFLFPLISKYILQPVLNQMFLTDVAPVIGDSDIVVMLFMFALVISLPIAGVFISRHRGGITEHNTRSYMSGVNAADDRHFLNSFGDVQSVYMSNWYMIDVIGELKIMKPCLMISAALLGTFMVIIIGGAL